ncbi:hypothetical protein [Derxia lacustris]|uniref:hypothetical protein n=1 Tax=Derxia lacustris TaxID=764842 RepID=UPI00111C17C3|nr:hypothetical protein [Derxia lacustris]
MLKVRADKENLNRQFDLDDPYGSDVGGDGYIKVLLHNGNRDGKEPPPPTPGVTQLLGYHYVETIDPKDGVRYRYTAARKAVRKADINAPGVQHELQRDPNYDLNIYQFILSREPATGPAPRYGLTFDDISTHEEREYWIAGSSLKVIDLQTNEVMAERIGYMVDPGQGYQGSPRSP